MAQLYPPAAGIILFVSGLKERLKNSARKFLLLGAVCCHSKLFTKMILAVNLAELASIIDVKDEQKQYYIVDI